MKEWTNWINPFCSAKVLLWRAHLEGCANKNFLPPVQVDVDPTNLCNYSCSHCNAWVSRHKEPNSITEKHLLEIADFIADWGVHGCCISGGGESLMNEHVDKFIKRLKLKGVESGVITNGFFLRDRIAKAIVDYSRWCGISVDAATSNTFNKVKGVTNNTFSRVISNIKALVKLRDSQKTYLDVAFKFLIHPYNAHEIYDAAKLAKELGVEHFHCRTVGLDNIINSNNKFKQNDFIPLVFTINEQFEQIFELEDGHFQVFGVRHKFNPDFTRKVNFSKCWAIPLITTFAANGDLEMCFDRRGDKNLVMTSHLNLDNVKKYWNSEAHHKLIDSINPKACPRCTFQPYNEIVEQGIIKDGFCRSFP